MAVADAVAVAGAVVVTLVLAWLLFGPKLGRRAELVDGEDGRSPMLVAIDGRPG